jgi:hypothetical protein
MVASCLRPGLRAAPLAACFRIGLLTANSGGADFRQVAGHIRQPMGDYMDDLALALNAATDPNMPAESMIRRCFS